MALRHHFNFLTSRSKLFFEIMKMFHWFSICLWMLRWISTIRERAIFILIWKWFINIRQFLEKKKMLIFNKIVFINDKNMSFASLIVHFFFCPSLIFKASFIYLIGKIFLEYCKLCSIYILIYFNQEWIQICQIRYIRTIQSSLGVEGVSPEFNTGF